MGSTNFDFCDISHEKVGFIALRRIKKRLRERGREILPEMPISSSMFGREFFFDVYLRCQMRSHTISLVYGPEIRLTMCFEGNSAAPR